MVDRSLLILARVSWILEGSGHAKRIERHSLVPVGQSVEGFSDGCRMLFKFRDEEDVLHLDDEAELACIDERVFLRAPSTARRFADSLSGLDYVLFCMEGTKSEARCIAQGWREDQLQALIEAEPTLRLDVFGVPPTESTALLSDSVATEFYRRGAIRDEELFGTYASAFLSAPHILVPLLEHVFGQAQDAYLTFPIRIRKLADQLRTALQHPSSTVRISHVPRSHANTWEAVRHKRFAFLDGGVSSFEGLGGMDPMAMRVGVYDVECGQVDLDLRERWTMYPFIVGDIVEHSEGAPRPPSQHDTEAYRKRLREGVRYLLEPLSATRFLSERNDIEAMLVHGPFVTRYVTYNEDDPNYLPCLKATFLAGLGIGREDVSGAIKDIPPNAVTGAPLWNQLMAVYAYAIHRLSALDRPIAGVIERTPSRAMIVALVAQLEVDKVIDARYRKRVLEEVMNFDVRDDFLFGCMLRAGEFVSPVKLDKNPEHQAVPRWAPVIRQVPKPWCTMLKVRETAFPFRIEMNARAREVVADLVPLIYHTALLLPRYAFPVGLDIADQYAKIPDWLSRGVSSELSSRLLLRAIGTGDAALVNQVRTLLARGNKGFWYRPQPF